VSGGELRIGGFSSGSGQTVWRQADLSGTGLNFNTAFLSFSYRTTGSGGNANQIAVEVSGNNGTTWTTLETFSGGAGGSGTRMYDVTGFISNNMRIRFRRAGGYGSGTTRTFFADNVEIHDDRLPMPGHWEVRINMSDSVTSGDDINAVGIRAHDGTSGAGGTELNIYAASYVQLGVNNPTSGTLTRSYTLYPYITSGCSAAKNDFDYDSASGTVGSMSFISNSNAFTQNFSSGQLSVNNSWSRGNFSGWTTDQVSADYGIWTGNMSITSYIVSGGQNSNYATFYMTNSQAANNPPTANPAANSFRIYLPTDSGSGPVKPQLSQRYTQVSGPNPVGVGQTGRMRVSVIFHNPTAHPVTFSSPNHMITSNIPGGGVVFAGNISVTNGGIISQPSIGGTGNISWDPGVVVAGGVVTMHYDVDVTPASNGQRLPLTAAPSSANSTRARYVDETGNVTQPQATYLFGGLCELAVSAGSFNPAPSAGLGAVNGRVFANGTAGLLNATVTITDANGNSRVSRTGSFGYFSFEGLMSGETYVVSVTSRNFQYAPQVVTLADSMAEVTFMPISTAASTDLGRGR
ncbi:MAG: carboxypeptidase regulatory-like domain-containing protein, partial [Acidobacteria bacterium]|nr:carboxypeptidase regulatory-like domain-containing protein [Acidobacteriota bacterium]